MNEDEYIASAVVSQGECSAGASGLHWVDVFYPLALADALDHLPGGMVAKLVTGAISVVIFATLVIVFKRSSDRVVLGNARIYLVC